MSQQEQEKYFYCIKVNGHENMIPPPFNKNMIQNNNLNYNLTNLYSIQ